MSDHIATRLTIGSPIPRRLATTLARALSDHGLRLEWGNALFTPATASDLLEAAQDSPLSLCDADAPYSP